MSEVSIVSSEFEMGALGIQSEMNENRIDGSGAVERERTEFDRPSGSDRLPRFIYSIPFLAIFAFLIASLIGVLGVVKVTHQHKKVTSPFDTRPGNMWAFIVALFIYSFAFATTKKLQSDKSSYSEIASYVTFFSGALTSVSIVSIFLPRSCGWLVFFIWFLLLVMAAFDLYCHTDHYKSIKEELLGTLNRLMKRNSTEQGAAP